MMYGKIKRLTSRGFGFIETTDEIDFFMHFSDYDKDWKELLSKFVAGEVLNVSFEVDTKGIKGPKAMNVRLV